MKLHGEMCCCDVLPRDAADSGNKWFARAAKCQYDRSRYQMSLFGWLTQEPQDEAQNVVQSQWNNTRARRCVMRRELTLNCWQMNAVGWIIKISQTSNSIMTNMREREKMNTEPRNPTTQCSLHCFPYTTQRPPTPKTLPCFPFNPSTVQREGGG